MKIYYNRRFPLGHIVIISVFIEPLGITAANIIITCCFQKVKVLVIMSAFSMIYLRRYIPMLRWIIEMDPSHFSFFNNRNSSMFLLMS
jgi:hypothetical protein